MSSPSNITISLGRKPEVSTLTAVVSLGSNMPYLGLSSTEVVQAAIERLRAISSRCEASSLYLSEALDCVDGTADFVNAAVRLSLESKLSGLKLLDLLQGIETDFDRQRSDGRNRARTLDLDIITIDKQIFSDSRLTLPHPRATQRKFVLLPMAEIDSEIVIPGQALTVRQLLDRLTGQEKVVILGFKGLAKENELG